MAGFLSLLKRVYLSIYNWAVFFGWLDLFLLFLFEFVVICFKILTFFVHFVGTIDFRAQVLYFAVKTLMESGHEHVYNAVEKPLLLAQTAAVLEIIHGLIGTTSFKLINL